jgi:hypothetical protein
VGRILSTREWGSGREAALVTLHRSASVVLKALTLKEQGQHEKAIAKLRAELFRENSPSRYFIVPGSEKVLPPSVEGKWMAGEGSYRVLHLGGLEFLIDCADLEGHTRLIITHKEGSQFWLWLIAAKGHTIVADTVEFKKLASSIRTGIRCCLMENWWSVYCQRYNPPKS